MSDDREEPPAAPTVVVARRVLPGFEDRLRAERVRGIEPPYSAWEADVLPLNYTRVAASLPVDPPRGFGAENGTVSSPFDAKTLVAGASLGWLS